MALCAGYSSKLVAGVNLRKPPEDLNLSAIKAARRLQALPDGRLYLVALIKMVRCWFLFLVTPAGVKIEKLMKDEKDNLQ